MTAATSRDMATRLPGLPRDTLQARARRALALPGLRLGLLAAAGLLGAPLYLRYFAWALGQCGVGFWAPRP